MTTDLERIDGSLVLGERFVWTNTSLSLRSTQVSPTMEELAEAGRILGRVANGASWWIGDWMLLAERTYGSTYTQGQAITGLAYGTLANLAAVCRAVESSRRHESLSFAHHAAVAPLAPWAQDQWLALAEREGLSVLRLRARIQGDRELPAAAPARLRLTVDPDRAHIWQEAAADLGLEFEDWAAKALDAASRIPATLEVEPAA